MSELRERLALCPDIMMVAEHVGLTWEGKYPRDNWLCTIQSGGRMETFEFFENSRVLGYGWKVDGPEKWYHVGGTSVKGYKAAIAAGALVLKTHLVEKKRVVSGPDMADVLRALLDDSRACEQSFANWCSDMGADMDSRKALDTYLACQANGDKISKVLRSLVSELRELSH